MNKRLEKVLGEHTEESMLALGTYPFCSDRLVRTWKKLNSVLLLTMFFIKVDFKIVNLSIGTQEVLFLVAYVQHKY